MALSVSFIQFINDLIFIFNYLVPDEVVIELVKKRIIACEKECRHWIIEGFPRTKIQALSLAHLGVIPDKMIAIKCAEQKTKQRIKQNLLDGKV